VKDCQNLISASLLRLRIKSPFFATLALFAQFISTDRLSTAGTDGKTIWFNPDYLLSLPSAQQDGLLLHEVLHAALLHRVRCGLRDPKVWNIAADIVINGMIMQQGTFELPPGGLREPKLENFSVEEVYELLFKRDPALLILPYPDLLYRSPEEDTLAPNVTLVGLDSLSQAHKAMLESHWKNALQQAKILTSVSQGNLPAGLERELGSLTVAQLNWRSYLWRYLVQTPTDFQGFDRRLIGQGLYLESLVGESVQVFVAVDTSGSIDPEQLRLFLNEVQGILGAYPHLYCELYFVDATAYGPYVVSLDMPLPSPQGGGGTSFIPFFEKVAESWDQLTQAVCVYLTDGYGYFPAEPPSLPVLWVVTPGGLDLDEFPFGEAVRLIRNS
jgi:predicted metal-dependent peptidase